MPSLSVLAPTFDDEFSSFVSSAQGGSTGWATELPFWGAEHTLSGNNEAEYYVDSAQANSPFSNQNGVLTIQATLAASNGGNPLGLAYNSGAITTYKSFSQLYGYFEIRAQLPSGTGLWPAFWLMPTNFKPGPELDVFEVLGNQPSVLYSTVHSANPQQALLQVFNVADTSATFHTYGVDWEAHQTVYYVDGKVIGMAATPADMNVPMYMILNLAVGGMVSWPGAPTVQTSFPASLKIDYVHAYQTASTIGWTDPTPKAPAQLVLPALQAPLVYGNAQAYVNVQHYGNQDGGSPLGGIGVALRNAAGLIVATGVTDARGFYNFFNLAPGNYSIQYLPPQQYSIRPGNFADPNTGVTSSFTLTAGQNLAVPYQLMTSSAELAGTVQLDGATAANVAVKLLDQNGNIISTTLTDVTGRFNFWTAAGQYAVEYDPAAGTRLAADSLADPTTRRTVPIVLADGQAFLLVPEQLVSTPQVICPIQMTVSLMSDTGASASDGLT
ncbi:MAG: glycosyl hydrolase family protein, partial [Oxalobacteraceae bacterium]